jgi:AcrR family transcriptional regulator
VFYRYFTDKEDLLAALAESFLHDVVTPSGLSLHLPDSPPQAGGAPTEADNFFTSVVTGYWSMFKQNIGIMIAVAQLAATQERFAAVQNEFRRFGMDIVAASVRRAQEQGYGTELNPEHTAAAIALLFENFTTVFVGTPNLGVTITDEDAIAMLSRIWKKTLYGF